MQRHILLMSVLITIRRIGVKVGPRTPIQHIHRSVTLLFFTKTALSFHESFHRIRHRHVDIQHMSHTDRPFRYTRIRADLDLRDVLRFHLTQHQPYVTVNRHVVDAEVVIRDQFFITGYHQLRHHLQHIQ